MAPAEDQRSDTRWAFILGELSVPWCHVPVTALVEHKLF